MLKKQALECNLYRLLSSKEYIDADFMDIYEKQQTARQYFLTAEILLKYLNKFGDSFGDSYFEVIEYLWDNIGMFSGSTEKIHMCQMFDLISAMDEVSDKVSTFIAIWTSYGLGEMIYKSLELDDFSSSCWNLAIDMLHFAKMDDNHITILDLILKILPLDNAKDTLHVLSNIYEILHSFKHQNMKSLALEIIDALTVLMQISERSDAVSKEEEPHALKAPEPLEKSSTDTLMGGMTTLQLCETLEESSAADSEMTTLQPCGISEESSIADMTTLQPCKTLEESSTNMMLIGKFNEKLRMRYMADEDLPKILEVQPISSLLSARNDDDQSTALFVLEDYTNVFSIEYQHISSHYNGPIRASRRTLDSKLFQNLQELITCIFIGKTEGEWESSLGHYVMALLPYHFPDRQAVMSRKQDLFESFNCEDIQHQHLRSDNVSLIRYRLNVVILVCLNLLFFMQNLKNKHSEAISSLGMPQHLWKEELFILNCMNNIVRLAYYYSCYHDDCHLYPKILSPKTYIISQQHGGYAISDRHMICIPNNPYTVFVMLYCTKTSKMAVLPIDKRVVLEKNAREHINFFYKND